jgi:protein transport protein SEC31
MTADTAQLSFLTSNPYTGVSRPGIAQVAPGKAPVSATLDFDSVQLPAQYEPIKDGLLQITTSLASCPLTAADKRQLAEAEKGVAILVKRLARGDIDPSVVEKVSALASALVNRNYNTTNLIQKELVNDVWKDHKDWLKGIKFLIQLASKLL